MIDSVEPVTRLPAIEALDALDDASFARHLAVLFEDAPAFLQRLSAARPHFSYDQLLTRADAIAHEMPEEAQIELLHAHPRIGAAPAAMSALSYREQGYERDTGTVELQARLDQLNDAYEGQFGFRFVIFVAGRSRTEIAAIMERQLGADRSAELRRGLADVIAIARDRLSRLVRHEEGP